ncbi:S53 family peptidase [Amantichitinum ursilacus]|uniref:Pseudomonalisin n=1 Tax=Amantichitinum ursilacus TaxID=857265 RepID=A0A0N0GL32_9NEIS|nr:S53 family peptidase [Amantichitinum ursilacus]KPC49566.1 Pseudomonalisin precursor [Amantichitinum ursilacus]
MKKLNLAHVATPLRLTAMAMLLATTFVATAPAQAAVRISADSRIKDLGVARAGDVKTVTLALGLRNKAALDTFITSLADPTSANYRHFLTPAQFAAQYGQSPATVAQVTKYLAAQGFKINKVFANNLLVSVTGTNAQFAAVFGTSIHSYTDNVHTWQAPATAAVIPSAIGGVVTTVAGLSTKPRLGNHAARVPNSGKLAGDAVGLSNAKPKAAAGNAFGDWTVADLAAKYNINPLYAKGLTGAGRTIGIATLAGYNQSDAYGYWEAVGLNVDKNRIVDIWVDGGPDADAGPGTAGAGETTLDVQQSGGVAPGAKIRVYIAPNTDAGFLDVFAQAVDENLVDTLSVSWGSPEIFYDGAALDAYHAVFAQAAAQGIPVIAAAGDAGAFDINRSYNYPACTTLLTVDFPAADPYVLAAGGTTLPNTFQHKLGPVTELYERPWGWNYLQDYIVKYYGTATYYGNYYTVGGGGGVSVTYPVPGYQSGLPGVQASASAQSMFCGPALEGAGLTAWSDLVDMPAKYAGRNLPDVSLNADPYSGYTVLQDGEWGSGNGGTSFVSPQLNGILTLIASGTPGRIGPINPQLYSLFKAKGYASGSPFKAITYGDNEYYKASASYNPASGLGSLDVTALSAALGGK